MKFRVKYLWIKVLLPLAVILCMGFYTMAPEHTEFKPVYVVSEVPSDYRASNNVLVVSNRTLVQNEDGGQSFGHEVDVNTNLKYGIAIENDSSFEFVFKQDLSTTVDLLNNNNLLVYVHGDGKTMEKTLWRASLMAEAYNADVMVFSWPTRNPDLNGFKNFKNSAQNAELSHGHLSRFLHEISSLEGIKERHVTVLFHSLGNHLLELTVNENELADLDEDLFDNLVLNAAAVDSKSHANWVSKLDLQEEIYVVSSRNDVNLRGAKLFTPLGHTLGLAPKGELIDDVQYIDMSRALGFSLKRSGSHSYFVGHGIKKNQNVYEFYKSVFENRSENLASIGTLDDKSGLIVINRKVSG